MMTNLPTISTEFNPRICQMPGFQKQPICSPNVFRLFVFAFVLFCLGMQKFYKTAEHSFIIPKSSEIGGSVSYCFFLFFCFFLLVLVMVAMATK